MLYQIKNRFVIRFQEDFTPICDSASGEKSDKILLNAVRNLEAK
jgi:hypothetical protein